MQANKNVKQVKHAYVLFGIVLTNPQIKAETLNSKNKRRFDSVAAGQKRDKLFTIFILQIAVEA